MAAARVTRLTTPTSSRPSPSRFSPSCTAGLSTPAPKVGSIERNAGRVRSGSTPCPLPLVVIVFLRSTAPAPGRREDRRTRGGSGPDDLGLPIGGGRLVGHPDQAGRRHRCRP